MVTSFKNVNKPRTYQKRCKTGLSTNLLHTYAKKKVNESAKQHHMVVAVNGKRICAITFADGQSIMERSEKSFRKLITKINRTAKVLGMNKYYRVSTKIRPFLKISPSTIVQNVLI